uniref:Uncharacterized protein n=1 Tax=Brassica oleracea var. oleracea TaxID=109376 RepID=A0A0D3CAL3_BRAOL
MYIKHASVPSATELPIERLIRAATPGNGSRASVGEDFVAMTKCRLHARNFMTQEGMTATKKMKRGTTAMPLSVYSLGGSVGDNCKQFTIAELESDRKPLMMVYNKKTKETGLGILQVFAKTAYWLLEDKVEYNVDDNPYLLHKPFIKNILGRLIWNG